MSPDKVAAGAPPEAVSRLETRFESGPASGTSPWAIVRMDGYRINTPWLARDPKCPEHRHPTRDCGCQVFKTLEAAETYIAEQIAPSQNVGIR